MTCSRGTWDDLAADRYAVTYQWLRDSVAMRTPRRPVTPSWPPTPASRSLPDARREPHAANPVNGAETVRAPLNRVVPRITGIPAPAPDAVSCATRRLGRRGHRSLRHRLPLAARQRRDPGADPADLRDHGRADVQQNLACRVRAEDLTDAHSARSRSAGPTTSSRRRSPATRACSARWAAPAATGTTSPPIATPSPTRGCTTASPIPGATGASYTVEHDDMDKSIYCRVRAEDNLDANSGAVDPDLPRAIVPPPMSGQPHLRGELSCTRGTWDDTPEQRYAVSYQWYRSGPRSTARPSRRTCSASPTSTATSHAARRPRCCATAPPEHLRVRPLRHRRPAIEGIAHPRRELTCTRGEWNDSPGQALRAQLPVAAQQRADRRRRWPRPHRRGRGRRQLPALRGHGRGPAHRQVRGASTRAGSRCGSRLTADADATAPGAANAYTLRVRNDNPVRGHDHRPRVDHARRVLLPLGHHDRRADDRPGPHRPGLADPACGRRTSRSPRRGGGASASASRPARAPATTSPPRGPTRRAAPSTTRGRTAPRA